ncbi:MAG: anti-sigma factor antagonist [Streptosporangiales bacterium]|nr:anti-sigma factor antagonist [Streptosporangiales bacterium]
MRVRGNLAGEVVRVAGRLDASTAAEVRPRLHGALERGSGDLILDLSELEVIDVTGLGLLVGLHRRAMRTDRRLVLRDVPPRVMRVLAVTRLHRVLSVEWTPAAVA